MATKLPPVGRASPAEPVARSRAAGAVDAAAPVQGTTQVEATQAASAVQGTAAAAPVDAAAAIVRAAPADLVKSVSDRLRRGDLTPAQAVEELIEDAVRQNLPGLPDDSPLRQQLRALLKSYVKDDPYLLTQRKGLGADR